MSATAERYSRISCSVTDVCTINASIGINGSIIIWKWIRMSMSKFLLTVGLKVRDLVVLNNYIKQKAPLKVGLK